MSIPVLVETVIVGREQPSSTQIKPWSSEAKAFWSHRHEHASRWTWPEAPQALMENHNHLSVRPSSYYLRVFGCPLLETEVHHSSYQQFNRSTSYLTQLVGYPHLLPRILSE
jgi:hypothetical protein